MEPSQISSAEDAGLKLKPPEIRLRKHSDYQRAYAGARKQHTRELSYFFALRDRLPERRLHPDETPATGPRIGLTVPKALGKAHDRNRIKRRMRAAVARHAEVLAGIAVDVILHPRKSVLTLDWTKLEVDVLHVFRTVRTQYAAREAGQRASGLTLSPLAQARSDAPTAVPEQA